MKRVIIDAITLPDAWFQLVYQCVRFGRKFTVDTGSYAGQIRIEFDWVDVLIREPYLRENGFPLIPNIPENMKLDPPVTLEYLADYAPYLMTGDKKANEAYTYGERINKKRIPNEVMDYRQCRNFDEKIMHKFLINHHKNRKAVYGGAESPFFNQVEWIIYTYKKFGHRNNQMVLQIAEPTDLLLVDPPCLRQIDTRIQDGKLHFFIYFRSWDLWGGFPANLAGISMLHEYMAEQMNVNQGEFVCTSKGLHLYGYAEDIAKMRTGLI